MATMFFITVDTAKATDEQNNRNHYNHGKILINNLFRFLITL